MNQIKNFRLVLIGMVAGALGGFLYFHFVGCNGSCLISSSPYISTIYGALMGGLTGNLFQKKPTKQEADS